MPNSPVRRSRRPAGDSWRAEPRRKHTKPGLIQRVVIIEFDSVAEGDAAHDSAGLSGRTQSPRQGRRSGYADRRGRGVASLHHCPQETQDAAFEFRRLPRSAPSGRRASDVAVPPRSRPRRAARPARLRRVLVRRAPFERLGDDRLARNVPGRGGRAVEAHQARDRGHLAALSPPVQRRAAHGPARLDDRRAGDLRLGPRRARLGRPHARDRPDGAARPPGRGDRRHPAAVQRRAGDREKRLVHLAGRGSCSCCPCRRKCRSRSPRRSARRA